MKTAHVWCSMIVSGTFKNNLNFRFVICYLDDKATFVFSVLKKPIWKRKLFSAFWSFL